MTKTFSSLGLMLTLLIFSFTAQAHSGIEHSPNLHSLMHIVISLCVGFAFIAACFLLSKRLPKTIRQSTKSVPNRIKK